MTSFLAYRKRSAQRKSDSTKPLPVADISHHRKSSKKLPVSDISHHKNKRVNEDIVDWVNKTQPEGYKLHSKNYRANATYAKDQHEDLAKKHASNLDGNHENAINAYISGGLLDDHETGSRHVNHHLIAAHNNGAEPKKHFTFGGEENGEQELNIDHLDDAIKQNKLEKSLTTYSGISFHPHEIMDERHTLHLPAYTSSSTSRAVASLYATGHGKIKHIIKISHPKGSTGVYVGDNDDLSPFSQKEHISPRNMKIKVNPEPEIHHDEQGNQLHVWSAKRITE